MTRCEILFRPDLEPFVKKISPSLMVSSWARRTAWVAIPSGVGRLVLLFGYDL